MLCVSHKKAKVSSINSSRCKTIFALFAKELDTTLLAGGLKALKPNTRTVYPLDNQVSTIPGDKTTLNSEDLFYTAYFCKFKVNASCLTSV